MNGVNPVWAQVLISIVGMVGLVVVNLWGTESASLNMIFGGLLVGGGWGAFQRQKWPVGKDSVDLIEKENEDSRKAELK